MKKIILLVCIIFLTGTVSVERSAAKSWKSWFQTALKSLKAETTRRFQSKVIRLTAVAAVRGAEIDVDPFKPYWKGGISEKAAKKLSAEKKEFAQGLELILAGKIEEGEKALKKFEKAHPDSILLPDIKEALSNLPQKSEIKPEESKKEEPVEKEEGSGKKKEPSKDSGK